MLRSLRAVIALVVVIGAPNLAPAASREWFCYCEIAGQLARTPFAAEKPARFWTDSLLPLRQELVLGYTGGLKRPTNNTFRYIPGTLGGHRVVEIFQKYSAANPAQFQLVILETGHDTYRLLFYRVTDGVRSHAEAAGLTKNPGEWMLWVPNTYSDATHGGRYETTPLFKLGSDGLYRLERNASNRAMQRTAGRAVFERSMISTFTLQRHTPTPAVADLASR